MVNGQENCGAEVTAEAIGCLRKMFDADQLAFPSWWKDKDGNVVKIEDIRQKGVLIPFGLKMKIAERERKQSLPT